MDAFSYHVSGSGLKYRLYSPGHSPRARPAATDRLAARRRRGCLAARRLLRQRDHAACQPRSAGLRHPAGTADLLRRVCRRSAEHLLLDGGRPPLRPADPRDHRAISYAGTRSTADRIYVAGCSNGGYMTLEMTVAYPDLFAASVPICGVVEPLEPGGPPLITDAELAAIRTPTWLVTSRDDDDRPARAQHHPRPRPHPRIADHPVRPRRLERLPVPRPLVVDLRGPQRPEPSTAPTSGSGWPAVAGDPPPAGAGAAARVGRPLLIGSAPRQRRVDPGDVADRVVRPAAGVLGDVGVGDGQVLEADAG